MSLIYDRHHPFLSSIKERYRLNKSGSQKETYHIVLDLSGSDIHYKVGDSVGILPTHPKELIEKTLHAMKASGFEKVIEKKTNRELSFYAYLETVANITRPHRSLLEAILEESQNSSLAELLAAGNREMLHNYLHTHEVWDLLLAYPEVNFTPQEFCDLLPPLLPRFYSIASSKQVVGDEVHLTVAVTRFEANQILRHGVGSNYLCHQAPIGNAVVPTYLHPSNGFTLPAEDHHPIIMVGPGTGIAPFRGFMQERMAKSASGKNWLFFGECHQAHDFFYEEYWKDLEDKGILRLACAFSRDQSEKVYVQHKMLHHASELWQWLEEGAYLYVCGNADRMAKDVEQTLLKIASEHGGLTLEQSRAYIKKLRQDKRYLRDVY